MLTYVLKRIGGVITMMILLLLNACQHKEATNHHINYLHLAHTRSYDEAKGRLMKEVETLDLEKYEVLMLGGDLVFESTGLRETLNYLDAIFDLSNPNTLWTLGNHDYHHHPEWIPETTQRPNTYSYHKNGITYLVLDSQEDQCNTIGAQDSLLRGTIQALDSNTTHLVLLHHKLLWMMDAGPLQEKIDSITNGGAGDCFHCIPPNNFYAEVYPELVKVQNKGIQVICIAGDIGAKVSEFEYETTEGIFLLASGLKDGAADNKVLLFDHDLKNKKLSWRFERLEKIPVK